MKKLLLALALILWPAFAFAQSVQTSFTIRNNVVSYTRDLTVATGSVGYTGMGFRPSSCLFFGVIDGGSTFVLGSRSSIPSEHNVNEVPTGLMTQSSHAMRVYTDSGFANSQIATVSSFDADGFTLSWTKVASPTGTLTFKAFCFQ